MTETLVVGSEGMGQWSKDVMLPLLQRTFPHTNIEFNTKHLTSTVPTPHLIIRSHFFGKEPARRDWAHIPYISWSGESYRVNPRPEKAPLFELNTSITGVENEVWFPHIVSEFATNNPTC